jgi:hypothetical protein
MLNPQELDPRIVRVTFSIGDISRTYEGLDIIAFGSKTGSPTSDRCTIRISNLKKSTRDYLSTQYTPFNKTSEPKIFTLEAGRKSYGTSQIYKGDFQELETTQPPDIACIFNTLTKTTVNRTVSKTRISLAQLTKENADSQKYKLIDESTPILTNNYHFNGPAHKELDALKELGNVDIFVDGDVLVLKDRLVPLSGTNRVVSAKTGMIGRVMRTEFGIRVKYFLDNSSKLGGGLTLDSKIDPGFNGEYVIYKLDFKISNRQDGFFWIAEATPRKKT